jgi:hypothetical protein
MGLLVKRDYDATTLLASAAHVATSTGEDAVRLAGMVNAFAFTLNVTVDEADGSDELEVFVQTKSDGTNWLDVVHFPQHVGNDGAKRYVEKVAASPAFAGFEIGSALGAGEVRDLIGDDWRVRFDIVDGSGSPSFTFSVTACPM